MKAIVLASFLESLAFQVPPQAADVYSMELRRPPAGRGYISDGNPLLGHNPDLKKVLLVKAPTTLLAAWGDNQLGKKSKWLQWGGRVGMYVAYGYIVSRNMQVGRVEVEKVR